MAKAKKIKPVASLDKELMWDAFIRMVDEGKLSVIVEGATDSIDGGVIYTDIGDITDVIKAFAKSEINFG